MLACGLAALAAGGCSDPPLAARSVVIRPRILAIIAEPPEIRPGQITALRVVTGGLTLEPTFRWYVCARPEATTTFIASSTFGQAEPNSGCFPDSDAGASMIGQGPQVFLGVPADILDRLEALAAVYGANLSAESLRRIARTSGIVLTVAVEMTHGSTVVRAIKRVIVSDRPQLNTNPPPPAFTLRFGGDAGTAVHMAISTDDREVCVPYPEQPLRARFGQRVEIAPADDEARWLEQYDSYDSNGGITPLREAAFYAWFTTRGWFEGERTRAPIRNTIWHAPYEQGTVTQWVVVRDGRGGASACRWTIEVTR